jgi:hypothetical protein
MTAAFLQKTDLSVGPPYIVDVGEGERITWAFNAEQAVTGVTANLDRINLDQTIDDVSTKIEATTLTGQTANVTVHNFVRGESYVLSVYFTNAAGFTWPRTLMIRCVA